ncbi:hypothetical protein [Nocardioides daphniae]|uniref:Glycosyltransferase family 2 protein n=1 Tax=Nocardioides daphniae TaxID=402297 RepID=A0A4P7U7H7_9ACTN|nr:hypothetical protein [Nocardioides daphniae]QCC76163.1 hypothetical protein E2C04_01225 [Nocardioides daphniae]
MDSARWPRRQRDSAAPPAQEAAAPRRPVNDLFRGLAGTTLVLVTDPEAVPLLPKDPTALDARVVHLWEHDLPDEWEVGVEPGWSSVLLVTMDRSTLRRAAAELPDTGPVTEVGVWLVGARDVAVVVPRPEWTPVRRLEVQQLERPGRGVSMVFGFVRTVRSRRVLQEVAVQAVQSSRRERSGLVTAYAGRRPAPGLDLRAAILTDPTAAVDPERVVPPDVVVAGPSLAGTELTEHHVLGRAPVVVTDPGLDPVDELVFTPRGWRREPPHPVVDLAELTGPAGVTEQTVKRARGHRAVRLDLGTTPTADLLKLTMAGIPTLVTGSDPRLAPELSELLAAAPELDDTLVRDAWSVKLRRATFDHHSTLAWRDGLAGRAGAARLRTGPAGLPGLSVLLATKREHELEGAVARVAAQVGAEIELVVATHGFTADKARLTEILGREPVLLAFDDDVLFGDVLTGAAQAASYDVVMKMDDDDWYSPHAAHDLLMARRFSGADVVGFPAEFVHLAEHDETIRRNHASECWTTFVAGGSLTLSRDLLREVGWFPPGAPLGRRPAAVDGDRVRRGTVYRTHGLDYVLMRHTHGHTWDGDPDGFRADGTVDRTWQGFRPPEEGL